MTSFNNNLHFKPMQKKHSFPHQAGKRRSMCFQREYQWSVQVLLCVQISVRIHMMHHLKRTVVLMWFIFQKQQAMHVITVPESQTSIFLRGYVSGEENLLGQEEEQVLPASILFQRHIKAEALNCFSNALGHATHSIHQCIWFDPPSRNTSRTIDWYHQAKGVWGK